MQNRKNEQARLQLRREERVYLSRGSWFIETREGVSVGPYTSKTDALVDADRLVPLLEQATNEDQIDQIIDNFVICEEPVDLSGNQSSSA